MIWNKDKFAKDEYKVVLRVISCKNSVVKSFIYSISAEKDLIVKRTSKLKMVLITINDIVSLQKLEVCA